jgi:hypothetical protein
VHVALHAYDTLSRTTSLFDKVAFDTHCSLIVIERVSTNEVCTKSKLSKKNKEDFTQQKRSQDRTQWSHRQEAKATSKPSSGNRSTGTLSEWSSTQLHTRNCTARDSSTILLRGAATSISLRTYTPICFLLSFVLLHLAHQQLLSHSLLAISDLFFQTSLSLTRLIILTPLRLEAS